MQFFLCGMERNFHIQVIFKTWLSTFLIASIPIVLDLQLLVSLWYDGY